MPVFILNDLKNIDDFASIFLEEMGDKKIFAFYGTMGAGKTTLIKAICRHLGAIDTVTSPTFTIVNEYFISSGESIYHFDLYRIEKSEELFDIGFEEYLDSGKICFLEWPEKIEEWLPVDISKVKIDVSDDLSRKIEF